MASRPVDDAARPVEHAIFGEGRGIRVRVLPVEREQVARLQVLDFRAIGGMAAVGVCRPAAAGGHRARQCQCCCEYQVTHVFLSDVARRHFAADEFGLAERERHDRQRRVRRACLAEGAAIRYEQVRDVVCLPVGVDTPSRASALMRAVPMLCVDGGVPPRSVRFAPAASSIFVACPCACRRIAASFGCSSTCTCATGSPCWSFTLGIERDAVAGRAAGPRRRSACRSCFDSLP